MFVPIKNDNGYNEPFEYLPAGAITPKYGMALKQASGLLAKASGTDVPTYICMMESADAVASGTVIPVIRVQNEIIFETVFSAAASAVNLGDKVTIATDGLRVTATTASGVAEVIAVEGTATGSKVRVRF